jgi:hypothetical protein
MIGCGGAPAGPSTLGRLQYVERGRRLLRHHDADAAEQDHVEDRDHGIDLAHFLEKPEQEAAGHRPATPPAMITAPIWTSTPRRRRWARTPEMLVPVIWVVAEATATAGGMP